MYVIAFIQNNPSDEVSEYDPRQLSLKYSINEKKELSSVVGFGEIEPQTQADGERPVKSRDYAGARLDRAEHHNSISAFKESIGNEKLEEAVPSAEEIDSAPAQEMNMRKIAKYLDF